MNYLEQVLQWFQAQNQRKKRALIGGIISITLLSTVLSIWVISPTYGILFNHLDSQDANQILTQLEQANIAYEVRNQGRDILIDKRLIDKTRIKLMGSGLQFAHNVGFELFDKTDFSMTDFSQKINYQRALQGELERTINSLDEIKQARVHLVIPENHLFQQEDNLPRAAVTLHLYRTLTTQQIKSIQQLIAASVANLSITNVIMVDQNGNALIVNDDEPLSNHFTAKKTVEQYLNEKVMQMLHQIYKGQRVMVKIDATLNYDELKRERLEPQHNGLITHEKETQHSITNKVGKTADNKDFMREKSYQLGHEKEYFTRANGTIERLTISVVLPQNTSKEKINQIERLVQSIVGFDAKRGDIISIEALITSPKPTPILEIIPSSQSVLSNKLTYIGIAGLIGLLLITLTLRFQIRARKRRDLLVQLNQWLIEHD